MRTRLLSLSLLCFMLSVAWLAPQQSAAQVTCNINGADLLSFPGATFPTTAPSTVGTSLFFGSGSSDQSLMFLPLFPSGVLAANDPLNVSIRLYMKRVSSDNDPIMGFTDGNGTNFCGFLANDGLNHFKVDGTLSGGTTFTLAYTSLLSCNGSCGTAVGDNYIVDMDLQIVNQAVTTIDSTFQGLNVQGTTSTYTQTLNPSTGIRFMLGKQTGQETYQIDSVAFVCNIAPSIVSTSQDTSVCEGDSVSIAVQAAGFGSLSYQWYQNGTLISGATSSSYDLPSAGSGDAGSYTCIVSTGQGADTSSAIVLVVNPNPTAQIVGPGTNCEGSILQLAASVSGGTPGYSYLWGPGGDTTATLSDTLVGNGTYTLLVTDSLGCNSASDTLDVVEVPQPSVSAGVDMAICAGANADLIATISNGTGPFSVLWMPDSLSSDSINVSPSSSTTYSVEIVDSNGCSASDTVMVTVNALPGVGFTFVNFNDSVQFTSGAASAVSWAWDFGDGNSSTDENPGHTYATSGIYTTCLTATDSNGCSNTVCDTVEVIIIGLENALSSQLQVYPNPSNGHFWIDLQHSASTSTHLQITNLLGEQVWQMDLGKVQQSHTEVSLNNLPAGVYLLKVEMDQRVLMRKMTIGY